MAGELLFPQDRRISARKQVVVPCMSCDREEKTRRNYEERQMGGSLGGVQATREA